MEKVVNLLRMQRNSKNLRNAGVLFVMQSILLVVSMYTNSLEKMNIGRNSYCLLLSQAICSMLLHLSLYQKLHRSIEKIIYIKEYPARFHPHFQAYVVAQMQFIIQFLTQLVAMLIMAKQSEVKDVITMFVAFLCVAQLDEMFYQFVSSPLKDKLQQCNFIISQDSQYDTDLPGVSKCLIMYVNSVITFLFDFIYFYIFPYLIFAFVMMYTKYYSEERVQI